jgi:alpha-beta hydrolase superfamily lysophospholipase
MLDFLIAEFSKTFPGIPVFVYGHSLGGGIVLQYILKKKPIIRGAIVTSPWLKLSFEPSKAKLILAGIMKSIYPSLVQPSGLIVKYISHNPKVIEDYLSDPLNHNKISAGLFHSAVSAAAYSLSNAGELNVPLLLMHGNDDMITSPEGSRDFASKTKLAELKIWDGGLHELHNETFNAEVFSHVANWIDKQL